MNAQDLQTPADVAVVIPTVLREALTRAVQSVFDQDFDGTVHILIGIDKANPDSAAADRTRLDQLRCECPANMAVTVVDLGYSTSVRHGGLYTNRYSGALRTILSYAANSRYIAYLDDDDWWGRQHLSTLSRAIDGNDWAFSLRWIVDHDTGWPICPDEWDSVGPGHGINAKRWGGFVSPSNLMLDKLACHFILPYWSLSPFSDGTGEDRLVFRELLKRDRHRGTGRFSCYYDMPTEVQRHPHHAEAFAQRQIDWITNRALIAEIRAWTEDAASALAAGDFARAADRAAEALRCHPHHGEALRIRAAALWHQGVVDAARSFAIHALAVNDHDPRIRALGEAMGLRPL